MTISKLKRFGQGAFVLFLSIAILLPIIWTITTSFKPTSLILQDPASIIPTSFTLDHYIYVWTSSPMPTYMVNSAKIAFTGSALVVLIASLAAVSFSTFNFPGKSFLYLLTLAFVMIPALVYLIGQYSLLDSLGLLNTHFAVLLLYIAKQLPYSLWILKNSFDEVPSELAEAAWVDGANMLQVLFRVVIPICRASMAGVFFYNVLLLWNEFIIAHTLLTSTGKRTIPVGLNNFVNMYSGTRFGALFAAAILSMGPLFILTIFLHKQIIGGLTQGALD